MRLWSIHPKYLDAQGLVALWREGLLAQAVLAGQTRGYRNHPQLDRFRAPRDPIATIGRYLHDVVDEAERRGYQFNRKKILKNARRARQPVLKVTRGQLKYEFEHLLKKLKRRSPKKYLEVALIEAPQPHPEIHVIPGAVESWEKIQ